jgi:4-amino-4-deoxy-L-arabinose transferase-like glycosyltransferase
MKIKLFTKSNYLLISILLLASFLRLWQLGSIPPHLTPDEASLGYNAYSILKTGKDEYGVTLPLVFKSFGDFKPGLYIYATTPFVAIMGLNEFSTRFASALAGIIAVYLTFLIGRKLFNTKIGLISAFFLAIMPWHIHFSRGAWEVNLSLTLTLAGIYFFLKCLESQKYLIFSFVFFALTLIAYQGAKLSTLIVAVLLVAIYFRQLIKFKKKYIVSSVLLGLLISLPIVLGVFGGQGGRLGVFSVFSYPRPEEYLQNFLDQGSENVGDASYYLNHPEWLNFARGVLGRYFNHFSARFLFFEGDWSNPRHSSPNMGMLVLADSILLILGFVAILRNKLSKANLFILLWLLLAPLPAVLSRDQIHAVRAFNMLIPIVFLIALGFNTIVVLLNKYKSKVFKYGAYFVFIIIYGASYLYFLDAYFIHLSKHDSKLWEYGYKQIVETITPIQNNYKEIKVQQSYAQPYIYFLFYQKYDPAKYQEQAKLKESATGDVGQVEKLGNICFCAIDWSVDRGNVNNLVVGDAVRIPIQDMTPAENFNLLKEIKYLDNVETAFRIVEVKK